MIKRIIIYIIGVFTLALGLVLNSKTGLGVSPILSVPYVFSTFLPISFGMATTIVYIIFVLVQIILVRKIDLKIILQIPFSYVFGLIIDFYNMFIKINNPSFIFALFLIALAILFTAIGVNLMLYTHLIVNPADGMDNTIAEVVHLPFGKVKLYCDMTMIAISLVVCFFIHSLNGLGIGTFVSAFCTGPVINTIKKPLEKRLPEIR